MPDPTEPLVQVSTREGVTTLTMNNPSRLNGWTMAMMEALAEAMADAAADEHTQVVVLTGTDPYYSAGVHLSSTLQPAHPRTLRAQIIEHNQALFQRFIDFPKPMLVAVNGPAIGAAVTSATLVDGIVASDKATFSTPFARLGVPPEGGSSVLFARLMGEQTAQRMLGEEGWQPTGTEAAEAGLVQWVEPHDTLLERAHRIARDWIEQGHTRSYRGGLTAEELREINARESVQVADAFLSAPFLMGQFRFLWSRGKRVPALTFLALRLTRPLWGLLL